jgi:hypothetical protein
MEYTVVKTSANNEIVREYQNKPSIICLLQEEEEILVVQERDGKLKPEQEYLLCPEVKMMMLKQELACSYRTVLILSNFSKSKRCEECLDCHGLQLITLRDVCTVFALSEEFVSSFHCKTILARILLVTRVRD